MGKKLTNTIELVGRMDPTVESMFKNVEKLAQQAQKALSKTELKDVEKLAKQSSVSASALGSKLRAVNDGLKLNPTSLDLITTKQRTLNQMIDTTKTRLFALKTEQAAFVESGGDLNSDQYTKLTTEIQKAENALERLNSQQNNFSPKVQQFGKRMEGISQSTDKAASAIKPFSAAAAAGIGGAIKTAAGFEASMSQVYATMGEKANDPSVRENLVNIAKEQGRATKYSASEAAEALNYLALAGYNEEQMAQSLPDMLTLAAAGNMDLAKTSDMVTDSMSALGLEVTQANVQQFGDQMARASSITNTSVDQLGEAYLTVGGTAKVLKGGTTEMATALGILADSGVKGAEGGTALRNTILSLTAPTDKAQALMDSLGVSAFDADGNMRELPATLNDLNNAMSGMSDAQKQDVISTLFNKADLKSVNALLANCGDRWNEVSDQIQNSSGAAKAMADEQQNNLSGQLTQLGSAFEGLAIDVGEAFLPTMKKIVSGVQGAADWFNKLGPSAKGALANVLVGTAAAAPALKGVSLLTGGIGKFIDKAGRANTITGKLAGKMGGLFKGKTKSAGDGASMNPVSGMSSAVGSETSAAQGKIAGFVNSVGNLFKSIGTGISTAFQGIGKGISTALQGASAAISNLNPMGAASFAIVIGTLTLALIGLAKCRNDVLPFLQGMSDIFTSMVGGVLDAVASSLVKLSDVALVLGQALAATAPFVESLGTAIATIASGLGEGIATIAEGVGGGIARIISAIGPAAPQIAAAIATIITAFSNGAPQIAAAVSTIITACQPIVSDLTSLFETLLTQIGPIIQSIGDLIGDIGTAIQDVLTGVSGVIDSIGGAIQAFFDGISGVIDSVGDAALNAGKGFEKFANGCKIIADLGGLDLVGTLTGIAGALLAFAPSVGNMERLGTGISQMAAGFSTLSGSFSSIESALSSLPGLLTQVSASVDQITSINDKLAPAVAGVQASLSSMQSAFTMVYAAILNVVTTAMNRLPQITTTAMTQVLTITTTMLSGLSAIVTSMMAGVVAAFQSAMASAVATVAAGMAAIRGMMSVSIQGPHLAVPHVSVSGNFSLNPPSAPSFSVSYYKEGGILSGATLFGMLGNTGLVGGEAGPEAVLPLNMLWSKLDEILTRSIGAISGYKANSSRLINNPEAASLIPASTGSGSIVVNFNPVINIGGEGGKTSEASISAALARAKDDLLDELEDILREQRERAYA